MSYPKSHNISDKIVGCVTVRGKSLDCVEAAPPEGAQEEISGDNRAEETQKRQLRKKMRNERPVPLPGQNRRIRDNLLAIISGLSRLDKRPDDQSACKAKKIEIKIACVWPLPGEVDLRPLCRWLLRAGYTVLLPQTPPPGQHLFFRHYSPGCPLVRGRYRTYYPRGGCDSPDIILVPLLAFDRMGGRLGYGGGYYDRSLQAFPKARRIGYGFSSQQYSSVPMGLYDQRLEFIATEKDIIIV